MADEKTYETEEEAPLVSDSAGADEHEDVAEIREVSYGDGN